MRSNILFANIFIIFFSVSLNAQKTYDPHIVRDTTVKTDKGIKGFIKKYQDKQQMKIREGKPMFTPAIAPGYTPELGVVFAAVGLLTFKTNPHDALIQRSSLPLGLSYSTNGAIIFSSMLSSYWWKDKLRVYGDMWYKSMPDNYWGIGYENAFSKPKSDSLTAYHRNWIWFNPRFLYQPWKKFFIGFNLDLNYTRGSAPSPGVATDPYYVKYNDRPFNVGMGIILRYDSRDIPVDTWHGFLINGGITFYSPSFGGDNQYQVYVVDYRHFLTIKRPGSTLAWQTKLRIGVGDVPYGEMSQLGSPFDLRGYTWGRYRDISMFFALMEFRYVFKKKSGKLSAHGLVPWVGAGTIFNSYGTHFKWLPNYGIGYRLEVQPRNVLRVDFGFGRETKGFYFNFNQAF